jgi:hypothetical protein
LQAVWAGLKPAPSETGRLEILYAPFVDFLKNFSDNVPPVTLVSAMKGVDYANVVE